MILNLKRVGAFSYFGSFKAPDLKIKEFGITMSKFNNLLILRIKPVIQSKGFLYHSLCNMTQNILILRQST